MSTTKEQLLSLIDNMPEAEQALLVEIAKRFAFDDTATADDLSAIAAAREEYAKGETISINDLNWK